MCDGLAAAACARRNREISRARIPASASWTSRPRSANFRDWSSSRTTTASPPSGADASDPGPAAGTSAGSEKRIVRIERGRPASTKTSLVNFEVPCTRRCGACGSIPPACFMALKIAATSRSRATGSTPAFR